MSLVKLRQKSLIIKNFNRLGGCLPSRVARTSSRNSIHQQFGFPSTTLTSRARLIITIVMASKRKLIRQTSKTSQPRPMILTQVTRLFHRIIHLELPVSYSISRPVNFTSLPASWVARICHAYFSAAYLFLLTTTWIVGSLPWQKFQPQLSRNQRPSVNSAVTRCYA